MDLEAPVSEEGTTALYGVSYASQGNLDGFVKSQISSLGEHFGRTQAVQLKC